jgi:hypothetical protein
MCAIEKQLQLLTFDWHIVEHNGKGKNFFRAKTLTAHTL